MVFYQSHKQGLKYHMWINYLYNNYVFTLTIHANTEFKLFKLNFNHLELFLHFQQIFTQIRWDWIRVFWIRFHEKGNTYGFRKHFVQISMIVAVALYTGTQNTHFFLDIFPDKAKSVKITTPCQDKRQLKVKFLKFTDLGLSVQQLNC